LFVFLLCQPTCCSKQRIPPSAAPPNWFVLSCSSPCHLSPIRRPLFGAATFCGAYLHRSRRATVPTYSTPGGFACRQQPCAAFTPHSAIPVSTPRTACLYRTTTCARTTAVKPPRSRACWRVVPSLNYTCLFTALLHVLNLRTLRDGGAACFAIFSRLVLCGQSSPWVAGTSSVVGYCRLGSRTTTYPPHGGRPLCAPQANTA